MLSDSPEIWCLGVSDQLLYLLLTDRTKEEPSSLTHAAIPRLLLWCRPEPSTYFTALWCWIAHNSFGIRKRKFLFRAFLITVISSCISWIENQPCLSAKGSNILVFTLAAATLEWKLCWNFLMRWISVGRMWVACSSSIQTLTAKWRTSRLLWIEHTREG